MALNKKTPEVRFDGFSDEWKNEQLLYLGDFLKGNGYSKNDLKISGHPIILYGRLYTNYNLLIEDIDTYVEPKEGSIYSEGGEVIIPSSGESAEDIIVASVIKNKQIIIGGDLNVIRPYETLNSQFVALSISNGIVYKDLVKKAQGKSVVHIRNSDIQETFLPYPHISEQEKIADFFLGIDRLIVKHQTHLTKLKNLKNAMLVKMFPREGATVPEIRFKGFDGEWKKEKLGILADITTGISNREDSGLEGEYTFFDRSEDVRKSNIYLFDCESIIVAGEGSDFVPKYFKGKFDLHQRTYAIMNFHDTDTDGLFLFYFIHLFRRYFLEVAVGSTVKSLRLPMFENMVIIKPSFDEQKKIGSYFQRMDSLITNHKQQLSKLQNIKKALLNKLFIN